MNSKSTHNYNTEVSVGKNWGQGGIQSRTSKVMESPALDQVLGQEKKMDIKGTWGMRERKLYRDRRDVMEPGNEGEEQV